MVIFMLDKTALVFVVLGAINWGIIGIFRFDLVSYICGGPATTLSRVVYALVGLAGLWCISFFARRSVISERD